METRNGVQENLTIAQKLFAEIEDERQEIQQNAILTAVTLVGLLIGVYFQVIDAPAMYVTLSFIIAYLAGGVIGHEGGALLVVENGHRLLFKHV